MVTYLDKKNGFVLGVLLLSIFYIIGNISLDLKNIEILKSINACIGIIGGIFYFLKKPWYKYLLLFWANSQIIIIEPIWNTTQVYDISFSYFIEMKSGAKYSIGINILGIIYSGLAKLIFLNSYIGKELKLAAFKKDSSLSSVLPSTFKIIRNVKLDDEKDWFLIEENKKGSNLHALIKRKEAGSLKLKKINQILFFRIVPELDELKDEDSKENFKKGGLVKTIK